MPKRQDLQKILVIGSGPIVIGQAAEFDYAGTQACRALKEEGYTVILVNSNPATIMTDRTMADEVYIEPLTVDCLSRIIRKENPDGLVATLGGQTGLNLAVELAQSGIMQEYGVAFLGTDLTSIRQAEDREAFRLLMEELGEPVVKSDIVHHVEEARRFVEDSGYPVIVRPAYTLGGTGGGLVYNEEQLENTVAGGLKNSPVQQVILEESIAGFKEIEYEVMRDAKDQAVIICDMENIDPVGVHTGDSVVVAPAQTLSDHDQQRLHAASLKVIRALGIEGGCNIQFAFDSDHDQYYIIEVNPRVSRSSALASKATGYPIAKITSKLAVGYTLDEIRNPGSDQTFASYEPVLDYVVTKFPRWPFDKFNAANRKLGTQMKATGEVMAIGQNVEESLLKAVRSLEAGTFHLEIERARQLTDDQLYEVLRSADDERLFIIGEAIRRGISVEEIWQESKIDRFFLNKMKRIVDLEKTLTEQPGDVELLAQAKQLGFSDPKLAELWHESERDIKALRSIHDIIPAYRKVETGAGGAAAETPYYYGTYGNGNECQVSKKPSVLVLGSGPIRIGQGIEFDYATVHAIWAIKEAGFEAVVINNNPETVSTDSSISDKLYFEPLTVEDVMHVIERENPVGVVIQFGGQTAINLASGLSERGVQILGTDLHDMDRAENRELFEQSLSELGIPQPPGKTATSQQGALAIAADLGYPVLVRPSYVLGGRAMEIVYHEEELQHYMEDAVKINPQHPVLIDRYLTGKEIEVDAISDGNTVVIPGIMEHIERAGVHSGDSIAVYPTQNISASLKDKLIDYTLALARGLRIVGLLNIQFVIFENEVYVIEVNPRSSRTVPFLSKITGVPMAKLATKAILGEKLADVRFQTGCLQETNDVFVKVPVFSFAKLRSVDITLGPEMKSTGEVMGRDHTLEKALYKGLIASGMDIPTQGSVLFTIADKDKQDALPLVQRFYQMGYRILATQGTAVSIREAGIPVTIVNKISKTQPGLLEVIRNNGAQFVVNTPAKGKQPARDGFRIRRESVENGVVCLTSFDTVAALLGVLESMTFRIESMSSFQAHESVRV